MTCHLEKGFHSELRQHINTTCTTRWSRDWSFWPGVMLGADAIKSRARAFVKPALYSDPKPKYTFTLQSGTPSPNPKPKALNPKPLEGPYSPPPAAPEPLPGLGTAPSCSELHLLVGAKENPLGSRGFCPSARPGHVRRAPPLSPSQMTLP